MKIIDDTKEHLLVRIYHWFLLVIAFIVVFCAVVFTITRLLTPLFNQHRSVFEHWASELVGAPVKVQKVSFSWRGVEPEMLLTNLRIYQSKSKQAIFAAKKFYVGLDVIHSLIHWQLKPENITIDGVQLSIKQQKNGKLIINDLTVQQGGNKKTSLKSKDILAWLLAQKAIYLKNITVQFTNELGRAYPVYFSQVSLLNSDEQHNLAIQAKLTSSNLTAKIIVDMQGQPDHWQKSKLTTYIKLSNVNLTHWLTKTNYQGYKVADGYADTQVWLSWQNGHWLGVHGQVQLYDLQLHSLLNKTTQWLRNLNANFGWQPTDHGWQLAVNHLGIITDQTIWPADELLLNYQKANKKQQAKYQLWLQFIDLADIRRLLVGSSLLPVKVRGYLQHMALSGEASNLDYKATGQLTKPKQYNVSADLAKLSIRRWSKLPGITNLTGRLQDNNQSGSLVLHATDTSLNFGKLFAKPLAINQLVGTLAWQHQVAGGWLIQGTHIIIGNSDLAINGEFGLHFVPGHRTPYLSVLAGYNIISPLVVKKYLPVTEMPKSTYDWLSQAFLAGKPLTGTLMLRGDMKDFPFAHNKGVFQVDTKVKDLTLRFSKDWPVIKHIYGDLLFANHSMVVTADSAQTLDNHFKNTTVTIPVIAPAHPVVLMINGQMHDPAKDLFDYIYHSPLKDTVGKSLAHVNLIGQVDLGLHITLPVDKPMMTQVQGQLKFLNNQLTIPNQPIKVTDLQGSLNFTASSMTANKITGDFYGQPVTATISTSTATKTQPAITAINFSSKLVVASLMKHFSWLKQIPLSGSSAFTGSLSFPAEANEKADTKLVIKSDLYGIGLDYPVPLAKLKQSILPSTLTLLFPDDQSIQLSADLGKRLHAALLFKNTRGQLGFYSGNIRFGQQEAYQQKEPGLVIDGYLPSFDGQSWQSYLKTKHVSNTNNTGWRENFKKILRYVDIHLGELKAFSFDFKPAEIKLSANKTNWFVSLITQPIDGTLTIPDDYPHSQLSAYFQRLYLADKQQNVTTKFSPKSIPAFFAKVEDFRYGDKDFGQLMLSVTPDNQGIKVDELAIHSPWLSAMLSGSWHELGDGKQQTHLAGNLSSDDFLELLTALHIKSDLLAKQAKAQVTLSWLGAPYKFSIDNLVGSAFLQLNNGWLTDLNKATTQKLDLGKLITLLSVRHLLFQFGDLTHSGYNFDSLTGHLNFDKGVISTNDLALKGPVANINANGMVDLVRQWLDLHLTIAVNATSSLPVIATIASGFNPIVGVATFVVDKVAHKALMSVTTYHYKLIGPWANPKVLKEQV